MAELFGGNARNTSDADLAAAVAETLGFELPPACVPGIAANVRLLEEHLAVLDA